jgi:hypothetical protein
MWKYHKEIPCAAPFISNKQKFHFSFFFTKSENKRAEQVLPKRELVPVGGDR